MSTPGRKPETESGSRSSGNGRSTGSTGALRTSSRSGTRSQTGWTSTAPARVDGGRWAASQVALRDWWRRVLAIEQLWVVVFLLVTTIALAPRFGLVVPNLDEGSIATRDYVAPRDQLLLAEDATNTRRARARADVLPIYDLDLSTPTRLEEALGDFFSSGRALVASRSPQESWEALLAAGSVKATPSQLAYLRRREFSTELEAQVRGLVASVYARGVVAAKETLLEHRNSGVRVRVLQGGTESVQVDVFDYVGYPDEARELVQTEIRSWSGVRANERGELVELVLANLAPNLHPNQGETLRRQDLAAASVEPVYTRLRKGQVILRKGDSVDAETAALIRALTAQAPGPISRILPVLGVFLAASLGALGLWLGLRREPRGSHRSPTAYSELLILLAISLAAAKVAVLIGQALAASFELEPFDHVASYLYAVPFAAPALLAMLLYGRWPALVTGVIYAALSGLLVGADLAWHVVLYALAVSVAVAFWVDDLQFRQRSFTLRAGGVVGVVGCGTTLVLGALAGGFQGGVPQLAFELGCALLGGILVAAVASFMVPVLESTFSLTTAIRLVELGNTNLPLLRRLAFEAPGSFQHSLMVANLAKAGCEAIGADPVLAYTGALYHDIGKVLRPDYFIENQRSGQNRHDKLQPSMSTLILISHVKDGVDLARAAHLPQPIIDAIEQHHGTRLITFFYHRALEQQEPGSGEVSEEKFRYPGPKPQSKAMGVLMLADGVEAASRSLLNPSPARIRSVIRAITDDCLKDGQLDETDLTLGDLKRVGEAFQRVLAHIYHRRIDYPGFDFDKKEKRQGAEVVADAQTETADPAPPPAGAVDREGDDEVQIDERAIAG